MYQSIIRPLLFRFDAEQVHHGSFRMLRSWFALPGAAALTRQLFAPPAAGLAKELWGLRFPNPLGLAAGFDKDALLGEKWGHFGFGFVELGTVTPRPQAGNPRKRLFRLPADQAIINRMGFNNGGVDAMVQRLQRIDRGGLIIGANIGKNKDTPNERAADDYLQCLRALHPHADYFVVNVSSPNTPGLRSLQEKGPLTELLQALQQENRALGHPRPLLLKIAPDLTTGQLDNILEVARQVELDGLIATNTTISREGLTTSGSSVQAMGAGGLSGRPLTERAREVIAYLHHKTGGTLPLIGVGGIMTPEDAATMLAAGASLVQVYTGFVYGGPGFVQNCLRHLAHPDT